MSKTPEEMAEERCGKFSHDDAQWYVAYEAWLDGYKAAMESTEWQMRVLNNLDELIKEPSEND